MRKLVILETMFLAGSAACTPGTQTPTLVPTAQIIDVEGEQETRSEDLPNQAELPPTNTPVTSATNYEEVRTQEELPTSIPEPTETIALATTAPLQTATLLVPTDVEPPPQPDLGTGPIGTIRVDHWIFEIMDVRSDPGLDPSRQSVVLLGNLANDGTQNDTFTAFASIMLRGASGREYEDDSPATWAAEDKYGADGGASMNPGVREFIAIAFDTPSSERSFTIIPGSLVSGWSGNLSFTLPADVSTSTGSDSDNQTSPNTIAVLRVDHWLFEITEIRSDPGIDATRQTVVLLGYFTNEGNQNDTFSARFRMMLQGAGGREYEADSRATWAAQDKYGADSAASLNPGEMRYIAIAFDTLSSEKSFTIIPGSLTASWSGNIKISVP